MKTKDFYIIASPAFAVVAATAIFNPGFFAGTEGWFYSLGLGAVLGVLCGIAAVVTGRRR